MPGGDESGGLWGQRASGQKWGKDSSCLPTAFLVALEVFWGKQWVQLEPKHQHVWVWQGSQEHLQGSFADLLTS